MPSNTSLRGRLLLAFGLTVLLLVGLALWSLWQMRTLKLGTDHLTDITVPIAESHGRLRNALAAVRTELAPFSATAEAPHDVPASALAALLARRTELAQALQAHLERVRIEPLLAEPTQRLADAAQRYLDDVERAEHLLADGHRAEARELIAGRLHERDDAFGTSINASFAVAHELATAWDTAGDDTYDIAVRNTLLLLALVVVLGIGLALRIAADVSRRVGDAVQAAEQFADGNLAHELPVHGSDEIATMLITLRRMRDRLGALVGEVRGSAESVASASAQLSAGNLELATRTEEQAAALQQTAASMAEIHATAQSNAAKATRTSELATQARHLTHAGSTVMREAVQTMGTIEDTTRRVEQIATTIDGLVFQTQVLALKAVRAEEQGRGIAMVAGDIQALAQRTAGAAREVKGLLDLNATHVAEGALLVVRAGSSIQSLETTVSRVDALVLEMAQLSHGQMRGLDEVAQAVGRIDTTTQRNAALVEEIAASAISLHEQADALVQAVALFRGVRRP